MDVKNIFALLVITVLSVGIVSTLHFAEATNYLGPNVVSTSNSQSGTLGTNSNSMNGMMGMSDMNSNMTNSQGGTLSNSTIVQAAASKALYEPNFAKTNVFGPGGLFPLFNDTFSCGNALTCGVSAGPASFSGQFKEGGGSTNQFEATYVSPITYGDQQVKGHTYMVKLIDTLWNSTSAAMPTRQAQFVSTKGNVAFDQIQHGHTMIDRSDAPVFFNSVALYGHVDVFDVTAGNKMVAHDIFTHLMVGKIVDENKAFTNLQLTPMTPTVIALVVANVPSGVKLPNNVGPLTADQAQSFTPLKNDTSLTSHPPINVGQIISQGGSATTPQPQSTTWPVDNPTQPLFFDFLLFSDGMVSSDMTSNIMTSSMMNSSLGGIIPGNTQSGSQGINSNPVGGLISPSLQGYYSSSNCNYGVDPTTNLCNRVSPAPSFSQGGILSQNGINSQGTNLGSNSGVYLSPGPSSPGIIPQTSNSPGIITSSPNNYP